MGKNLLTLIGSILSKPGDKLEARKTKSGRDVVKIERNGEKHSAVRYKNGTVVETLVRKKK